jgi:hypothetical protein
MIFTCTGGKIPIAILIKICNCLELFNRIQGIKLAGITENIKLAVKFYMGILLLDFLLLLLTLIVFGAQTDIF